MNGTNNSTAERTIINPHTKTSALALVLKGGIWYQKV